MSTVRKILAHLTVCLCLCLVTVVYLDSRNPMMAFLYGVPFLVLVGATALCAIATAVLSLVTLDAGTKHTGRHLQEKTPES